MSEQFAAPGAREELPLAGRVRPALVLVVPAGLAPGALDGLRYRLGLLLGAHSRVRVRRLPLPAQGSAARVVPLELDALAAPRLLGLALYQQLCLAEAAAGRRADALVLATASATPPQFPVGLGRPLRTAAPEAVAEEVAVLRAAGHQRVAVLNHQLTEPVQAPGAWAVTAPLADHPLLARAVLRRYAAG
ncbi:hypothetical protein C7C46_07605 [Streptomyces tateyamensis]|uniref:Uncharacterized protein n=1 Tax=Streptomyces tateyamensis TaxID=565073 RepID=A0A2V4NVT9_9ACTN|nr:hypothetical protein [Streptomyces tateyamensis]PYC84352.1 hypothetical protein C7C46_07605 [Streptomyces tateyamensis]